MGAAYIQLGPAPEQLVEGHIVWTVIDSANLTNTRNASAAAVAVLVREQLHVRAVLKNPGVLWFNDQYLVDPTDNSFNENRTRYPCTGAVIAVPEGAPAPDTYSFTDYENGYNESYFVTDPNNRAWTIDKWNISGNFVWSTHMHGGFGKTAVPDDGVCKREPIKDRAPKAANPYGWGYPCGGNGGPTCTNTVWYNAVLFFFLKDLDTHATPKNHTEGSTNYTDDVSGCHEAGSPDFVQSWPCPAADDNREGNSHPYNPKPNQLLNLGRSTHGFTADCTGDGIVDRDCHETRRIDLYYGLVPEPPPLLGDPLTNRHYVFKDPIGSPAPYHCHQDPDPMFDYCT